MSAISVTHKVTGGCLSLARTAERQVIITGCCQQMLLSTTQAKVAHMACKVQRPLLRPWSLLDQPATSNAVFALRLPMVRGAVSGSLRHALQSRPGRQHMCAVCCCGLGGHVLVLHQLHARLQLGHSSGQGPGSGSSHLLCSAPAHSTNTRQPDITTPRCMVH